MEVHRDQRSGVSGANREDSRHLNDEFSLLEICEALLARGKSPRGFNLPQLILSHVFYTRYLKNHEVRGSEEVSDRDCR